jgi:hypothetical protein
VFKAKGKLAPTQVMKFPPSKTEKKRPRPPKKRPNKKSSPKDDISRKPEEQEITTNGVTPVEQHDESSQPAPVSGTPSSATTLADPPSEVSALVGPSSEEPIRPATPPPPQLTETEALTRIAQMQPASDPTAVIDSNALYCPECYVPLHPDPKPEKLYIFLHALRYSTSLGTFETEMPEWSAEGYEWDRWE